MQKWKGSIVEESLKDNRSLNNLEIVKFRITNDRIPSARWHIYNVLLSDEDLDKIHSQIKDKWYMHFWKKDKIIVLFKNKKFILNSKDKSTWKEAINYGLSLGIPKKQLDFPIEF